MHLKYPLHQITRRLPALLEKSLSFALSIRMYTNSLPLCQCRQNQKTVILNIQKKIRETKTQGMES